MGNLFCRKPKHDPKCEYEQLGNCNGHYICYWNYALEDYEVKCENHAHPFFKIIQFDRDYLDKEDLNEIVNIIIKMKKARKINK